MIRALVFLLAAAPAAASTTYGMFGNQSVLLSTSGVIGSVSPGNSAGKTNVFVSSGATTAALNVQVGLSSRTVTIGKTFYVQHIDAWVNEVGASTGTIIGSLGRITIGTYARDGNPWTTVAVMTFTYSGAPPPVWTMEFAEPIPIASGATLVSSATTNTAVGLGWLLNFIGYEK